MSRKLSLAPVVPVAVAVATAAMAAALLPAGPSPSKSSCSAACRRMLAILAPLGELRELLAQVQSRERHRVGRLVEWASLDASEHLGGAVRQGQRLSASAKAPYDKFRILGRVLKVALKWLCASTE